MIHQPTTEEVMRYGHTPEMYQCMGNAHTAVPGIISGRGGFTLADLSSQAHRWDMVESTITESSGDITEVTDLVGSDDLTDGSFLPPDDVTSDADFGGRRACNHDATASEAMETTLTSSISQPYTFWAILKFTSISFDHGIFSSGAGTNQSNIWWDTSPTKLFVFSSDDTDGGPVSYNTGAYSPGANTSFSLVIVIDNTSSTLYANNSEKTVTITDWNTTSLSNPTIGRVSEPSALFSRMSWTACGIIDGTMSADDRASLEQWRQDNAA